MEYDESSMLDALPTLSTRNSLFYQVDDLVIFTFRLVILYKFDIDSSFGVFEKIKSVLPRLRATIYDLKESDNIGLCITGNIIFTIFQSFTALYITNIIGSGFAPRWEKS